MKIKILPVIIYMACIFLKVFPSFGQSTSWKGTSTDWGTAANWTNGKPTSSLDAIIGDVNFTGGNQPTIGAISTAKSLTIGSSVISQLTVNAALTVSGNINVNSNGTITQGNATISLTVNWTNGGNYTTTPASTVIFSGAVNTAHSLGGTVPTTFRILTINSGNIVTLSSDI